MADPVETPVRTEFVNHRWDFLTRLPPKVETALHPLIEGKIAKVVTARGDPLWGMSEGAVNFQENSGDWQGQSIIDHEKNRITETLKSPDPAVRDAAAREAVEFRSAVREGGETLNKYIESKSGQVTVTYEEAHRDADNKPKEDEGQTAAVSLISDEAESLKTEISGEFTPDKSGKLKKLAGFATMLEGVAGHNAKGLRQLHIWLEAKAVEIEEALEHKSHDLGMDADLSRIDSQLVQSPEEPSGRQIETGAGEKPAETGTPAPAPEGRPDRQIQVGAGEKQTVINSPDARQIQAAVKAGDESLLPQETPATADILLRTRELLAFTKSQEQKRQQVNLARTWASSHRTAN